MVINEETSNAFTISVMGDTGSLPTITENDEGKVLTVDDGEAVWAEGGSGIEVFTIDYSVSNGQLSGSYLDIINAAKAGKLPIILDVYRQAEDDPVEALVVYYVCCTFTDPSTGYYVDTMTLDMSDKSVLPLSFSASTATDKLLVLSE